MQCNHESSLYCFSLVQIFAPFYLLAIIFFLYHLTLDIFLVTHHCPSVGLIPFINEISFYLSKTKIMEAKFYSSFLAKVMKATKNILA